MSQNTTQTYPDMGDAFATMNQDWNGPYWVQNAFDLDFTATPVPQVEEGGESGESKKKLI